MISRRTFVATITGGSLAVPLGVAAQRPGKVYRVGFIATTAPVAEMSGPEPVSPSFSAFVQGLQALGYAEGQNLILERRSAEGRYGRFGDIATDLVRLKADVIVTTGVPMTRAAKAASTTIPIVMAAIIDPVGEQLVQSLSRPGGNITGLTIDVGPEIEAKRLELLKETAPALSRVVYLGSREDRDWEHPSGKSVRAAARALGVTLVPVQYTVQQYAEAFAQISAARAEALFVGKSPAAYNARALIVDFAARTRLPSTFHFRESVELGGLMSYGVNLLDNYRRAATYVDRILKGDKPADLPIERPTKFELVINVKAAKALGLMIPQSILVRADQILE